jgi:hypothetical protein
MKTKLSCTIILLLVLISNPVLALEPFMLYDNFNTIFLDPDKWTGQEFTNPGLVILESSREIDWGSLHLRSRVYGVSNPQFLNAGTRLFFTNSDEVTAIKARVRVTGVEAKGCVGSTVSTRAVVRLAGFFFNTSHENPTGNVENDVLAYIGLQRVSDSTDKPYLLHAVAYVYHCLNSGCSNVSLIGTHDFGTISLFKATEISIQWDKDFNQFIFRLDRQSPVSIGYNFSYEYPSEYEQQANRGNEFPPLVGMGIGR